MFSYNAANELTQIQPPSGASTAISYDANGNQAVEDAAGALTTYAWDGENRLASVSAPGGGEELYAYDGNGQRRVLTSSESVIHFTWDGQNVLLEGDGGATTARYIGFPGYWGGLVSRRGVNDSASFFYAFDASRNTRLLLGQADVTDSYVYTAFGVEME